MSSEAEKPSQFDKVEALLGQHPGVLAAKVLCEDSTHGHLTAYVVPRNEYLGAALTDLDEERKRIQKWRKTFDLMQMGKEAATAELGFNIAGWNSSYTRQPIPAREMLDWVESTVAHISSLRPQEILEIGCGTGLLLLRIAPKCKRYVATDFAPAVLGKLRKQMNQIGGSWDSVELLERSADNFDSIVDGSFDTIVINSVTQHFPNVSYLIRVMEGALRALRPGGNLFIGDVRSLPLLELYATSVEMYQAPPELSLAELRERIDRRVKQQEQLVISPAFFLAFANRNQKLSGAEIRLKRGHSDNELTRFRYDVVLHAGGNQNERIDVEWRDWTVNEEGIKDIRRMLKDNQPDRVAVTGIRNARVEKDGMARERVLSANAIGTAGELKRELEVATTSGIEPEELFSAGKENGYRVELSWASCHSSGSYDAFLSKMDDGSETGKLIKWPQLSTSGEELAKFTNVPGQNIFKERLIQQLLSYCNENLPQQLAPIALVLVDELPSDKKASPD
jgi:SAM-dependent methyltransferase